MWVGGSSSINLVSLVRLSWWPIVSSSRVAGLNEWLQAEERMKVNSQGTVYIINYPVLWGGIMVPRAGGTVPVAPTAPRGAGLGREAGSPERQYIPAPPAIRVTLIALASH